MAQTQDQNTEEKVEFVADDVMMLEGGETKQSVIVKKTIAPTAAILFVFFIVIAAIYFVLDYRISKSDKNLAQLVSNVETSFNDTNLTAVIKNAIAESLKELDTKVDVIGKRVTVLEKDVVELKKFNNDLNITYLLQVKADLDEKLKQIAEHKAAIDKALAISDAKKAFNQAAKPMPEVKQNPVPVATPEVKLAQDSEVNNYVSEAKENAITVKKDSAASNVKLPFEIVKIVKKDVINFKYGGQIYSLSVDNENIMGRYEVRVVDTSNNIVFVYDTKLQQYFEVKVGAND